MANSSSKVFPFQFEMNSGVYDATFFLTENRLITVSVMGQKRSVGLGSRPPRALALALAMDLIREIEQADRDALAELSLVGRFISRFVQITLPMLRQEQDIRSGSIGCDEVRCRPGVPSQQPAN